jgi:hypothetical protein
MQRRLLNSIVRENNGAASRGFEDSDHEDLKAFPLGQLNFTWEALNQDFPSHAKNYKDITTIANTFSEEELDLRLCMIERPFTVSVFDKFPKILNLFR